MHDYNQEILGEYVSEVFEKNYRPFARSLERLNIFFGHYHTPDQALRMRRYFMAAGTSILTTGLLLASYLQGFLSKATLYRSGTLVILAVIAFYALFRSSLNLRFSDPNLAVPQILVSALVTLYVMYEAEGGRSVFLMLLLMAYLFSVLQLTSQALLIYAVGILGAYGCLIGLLWRLKPQSLDLRLELLQWLALAITLPWFASMGGFISRLRHQLSKNNEELQRLLLNVQTSETSLAQAQRIAGLGGWEIDPVIGSSTWSVETYRLFGIDPAESAPTGERFLQLVHPEDCGYYKEVMQRALREGRDFDDQFRIMLPNGEIRWVHALGQPVLNAVGHTMLMRGTVMDITERKAAEEQISHLAHFDGLTGLANRNLFDQLLDHALAKAQRTGMPLALLFIDLDGFKQVNDRLGHIAGDRLLATFAQRLRECLRKSDIGARMNALGTPARLGGDEFVVLIDDFTERSQLEVIAQRILTNTGIPFSLGEEVCCITASIGISVYPEDGIDIDSLTKNADSAMYCVKKNRKNGFRFFSSTT